MSDYKCQYCPEVRPSRSRLAYHVEAVHRKLSGAQQRDSVRGARRVTDVVTELPDPAETVVSLKLVRAGDEIGELLADADDVERRMTALDARAAIRDDVRRATLEEVRGLLFGIGDRFGAGLVANLLAELDGNLS